MENDAIKQLLRKQLISPEKEGFNRQIVERLGIEQKKQRLPVFSEKNVLYWFLFIAGFVLFFYLQQGSKATGNTILIGSIISAIPLYLLLFNKIYALKNKYR